jgi:hypothetical protein
MLEKGQEAIDETIEGYVDAPGTVDNYKDAVNAINAHYNLTSAAHLAYPIEEVRFAAEGIGGSHE